MVHFLMSFAMGFFFAIFCIVAGVLYGTYYVKGKLKKQLEVRKWRNREVKDDSNVNAALEFVRIFSKVKFAVSDFGIGQPRRGRMVLEGSTISLYETILTNSKYTKLYYKVVNIGEEAEYFKEHKKDVESLKWQPNSHINYCSHLVPAGYTVGERLLGKINASTLSCKFISKMEKEDNKGDKHCPFFGTAVLVTLANSEIKAENKVMNHHAPLFLPFTTSTDSAYNNDGNDIITAGNIEDNLSRWCTMIVKFTTTREAERWVNFLNPTEGTHQWRTFVRSLPSLDVMNIVAARLFFENREGDAIKKILTKKINKKLSKISIPKPLNGTIQVHDVSPGSELPLITNMSQVQYYPCGEIKFDVDMEYRGGFDLQLELDLTIGKTRKVPKLVVRIRINNIRGRIRLNVGPPPSNRIWVGFHQPPVIDLTFGGHAASDKSGLFGVVIGLIPDLSRIITDIVKIELLEDMTLPSLDDFPLPNVEDTPPTSPVYSHLSNSHTGTRVVSHERNVSTDTDIRNSDMAVSGSMTVTKRHTAVSNFLNNGLKSSGRLKTMVQATMVPKTHLLSHIRESSGELLRKS
eukprot:Tbor_TRINITY_DN5635_c0_g2::TRINITY_DN5635_c0_g2_i1::g.9038::m.9038